MGVHNRISENKYNAMKRVTKTPADDKNTMRAFKVSASTCRNVRNTANYQEYCERVFRYHGYPKTKAKIKVETRAVKPVVIPVEREKIEELDEAWKRWEEPARYANQFREPKPSMLGLVLLFFLVILLVTFTVGLAWFSIDFLGGVRNEQF